MSKVTVSAVVPTLGHSSMLEEVLDALRRQGEVELIVVASGSNAPLASRQADRWIDSREPLPFSAATNRGIAASTGNVIATVNDDAIVDAGWIPPLLQALEEHPQAAAVQGVNSTVNDSSRLDGCGLAWNQRWQAVQWLASEPATRAPRVPTEIFGVSATAALYRRDALDAVSEGWARPFDEALGSYYEDVDLACRLRATGWSSWLVPCAHARHAGSLSGNVDQERARLLHRNRLLVLARLLGSSLWPQLGGILLRDLLDLAAALSSGEPDIAARIGAGFLSALHLLPRYARRGAPAVLLAQLSRFQVSS